ncbi:MAG: cyclase family protein [Dehalococcoidia bacterium]|nr:MAG: cyclase family protein [Dehalococcoidia bacterium]
MPIRTGLQSSWIDVSVALRNGMVHWPGDPPFECERVHDMSLGDANNLSRIRMGTHSGTHVDAPLHFIADGKGVDEMPLKATIGRARVIEISDTTSIKPRELRQHRIQRGERILIKTDNSRWVWKSDSFVEDFVYIPKEAAYFLAERGVMLVGVDYLSVGGYKCNGSEVHRIFLEAGIWLIEGLDLSLVTPGKYELICLPLKIVKGEGAPARAVVRPVTAARGHRR